MCPVKGGSIEDQDHQLVGRALGEGVEGVLKALGIRGRKLQEEAVAGVGVNGTIQPEAVVLVLLEPDGLDAFSGDSSALGGNQPDAAFIFEVELHLLGRGSLGDQALQLGAEVFLKTSVLRDGTAGGRS